MWLGNLIREVPLRFLSHIWKIIIIKWKKDQQCHIEQRNKVPNPNLPNKETQSEDVSLTEKKSPGSPNTGSVPIDNL